MCGIVGYIGKRNTIDVLLDGLKKLEYRGYDSAGVCLYDSSNIEIIKSVGRIKNLEEKLDFSKICEYTRGIAHTRWATHGNVTEENAHPHQVGKITLVHNGIIENADVLRADLEKKGYIFKSNTDTEVVAALLDYNYEEDFLKTIDKSMKILKGSYALGIIVEKDTSKIYAVKKDSPLVLGTGEGENFFASDITAINTYTNDFIFLDEGEVAVVTDKDITVYKDLKKVDKKIDTIVVDLESKSKNGYPHYMLKEINEEPVVLEKTLKPYLDNLDLIPDISEYEVIHIVACGSAMYAGMVAKYLLEEKANVEVMVDVASEYRYRNINYNRKTLVILISQSGETADTIAAMRFAKEKGQTTLAIVNVKTSTIARESTKALFIEAGEEIAVATTKAYLLQVALLSLLSLKLAYDKKLIDDITPYLDEFRVIPKLVKETIDKDNNYKSIANEIYEKNNSFFIGRKIDYAYCLEGSLKLKEVSYIHSEAYQAGELKHGTISLIDEGMPVFGILTDEDIIPKTLSNVIETKARGAKAIIITSDSNLGKDFDLVINVPKLSMFTQGLVVVPTLQLIAYHTASLRGCDIDKPKNLAKSVTVE
ncbi:MAG: glutamine--fructose-6-phosphate transaminase (isomerizing) [bacterium]|nr:glutamine--fructose-6-phosphate transaminase (isomerizing) [bacterium]